MKEHLSYNEYQTILNSLLEYHGVFYQFWRLVKPIFSNEVPTACVGFNKEGNCIEFLINKKFWDKQSDHNKKFIIAHECLHVINSHGKRAGNKMSNLANQAMDIVVNESLVKYFKFNRKEIDPKTEYYWLDNSFDNDPNILPWNSFEYYYNRLLKDAQFVKNKQLINDHSGLGSLSEQSVQEIINNLSDEDAESLKNISEDSEKNARKNDDTSIGNKKGGLIQKIENKPIKYKKKWESVIRRFEKKMSQDEGIESHWIMKDRRLYNLNFNIFLPSDIEQTLRKTESEKIATWFFMDTSGSCWGLAPRFFQAAKSLDPEKFDVKYFAFDTFVYEVDLKKQKVDGGGGTSFRCISDYIYKKNANPFVWVLTDGWGNRPNIPDNQIKKWSWFLTDQGSRAYIPEGCQIYDLNNFE